MVDESDKLSSDAISDASIFFLLTKRIICIRAGDESALPKAARFVVSLVPSTSYVILLPSIKSLSCSCICFLLKMFIRYSNIVAHLLVKCNTFSVFSIEELLILL